jgi:hypothetical protein
MVLEVKRNATPLCRPKWTCGLESRKFCVAACSSEAEKQSEVERKYRVAVFVDCE